jgi:hypothetical protein
MMTNLPTERMGLQEDNSHILFLVRVDLHRRWSSAGDNN